MSTEEEQFNSEEVVAQLRHICRGLGIQKPCEETLKNIGQLVEKEGENALSMNELRKAMENALKELN
jgi:hypothetical protein